MKFKIGDKVRYMDNDVFDLEDKNGTIYYIDNSSVPYEVILENWNKGHSGIANDSSTNHFWHIEEDLELVNHEYKVGDLVLLKNKRGDGWANNGGMDRYLGAKVRIKSIEKCCLNDFDSFYIENDNCNYIFRTTDIEKVINEPEIQIFYPNNINDITLKQIIKEMKIKPAEKLILENAGINLRYMEEKKMEILKIYRNRNEEYLRKEFKKKQEEILNNDRIQNVVKRAEEELNILLEKDEDNKFSLKISGVIEPTTRALLEQAEQELDEKIDKLYDLVKEVEAQLEIAENYETKIEILKRYNILDENGKIVNFVEVKEKLENFKKAIDCCCDVNADILDEKPKRKGFGKKK